MGGKLHWKTPTPRFRDKPPSQKSRAPANMPPQKNKEKKPTRNIQPLNYSKQTPCIPSLPPPPSHTSRAPSTITTSKATVFERYQTRSQGARERQTCLATSLRRRKASGDGKMRKAHNYTQHHHAHYVNTLKLRTNVTEGGWAWARRQHSALQSRSTFPLRVPATHTYPRQTSISPLTISLQLPSRPAWWSAAAV